MSWRSWGTVKSSRSLRTVRPRDLAGIGRVAPNNRPAARRARGCLRRDPAVRAPAYPRSLRARGGLLHRVRSRAYGRPNRATAARALHGGRVLWSAPRLPLNRQIVGARRAARVHSAPLRLDCERGRGGRDALPRAGRPRVAARGGCARVVQCRRARCARAASARQCPSAPAAVSAATALACSLRMLTPRCVRRRAQPSLTPRGAAAKNRGQARRQRVGR